MRCFSVHGSWMILLAVCAVGFAGDAPTYTVYRMAKTPAIDGSLADWPALPVLFLGRQDHVSYGEWSGADDCRAEIRMAWDEQNLYFAISVVDDRISDALTDDAAPLMFTSDCIQWAIDIGQSGGVGYDTDDYEYGFGRTQSGPCVYRWQVSSAALVPGRTNQVPLAVSVDAAKHTLTYEAAVPFKELLPMVPKAGMKSGFSILVQDRDGENRKTIEWTSGISAGKHPAAFGTLIFSDAIASASGGVFIAGHTSISDRATVYRVIANGCADNARVEWTLRDASQKIVDRGVLTLIGGTAKWTLNGKTLPTGRYTWSVAVRDPKLTEVLAAEITIDRVAVETIAHQLTELKEQHAQLKSLLTQAEKHTPALSLAYAVAAWEAVEIFLPYINEDIARERNAITLHNLAALNVAMKKNIASLTSQLANGPDMRLAVPNVDARKAVIRDGEFYVGQTPVLFVGAMSWLWQIHSDISHFAKLGINTVRADHQPATMYEGGKIKSDIPWWAMTDIMHAADRDRLALSDSPLPYQVMDAIRPFGPMTIDRFRSEYAGYLDLVNAHQPFDRFFSHLLTVEGQRTVLFDAASQMPLYRQWLKSEYGSIEKYNRINATGYAGFDDVPFPAVDAPTFAQRYDRIAFMQWNTVQNLQWCVDEMRKRAPHSFITGYGSGLMWDDESDFPNAVFDPELEFRPYDFADADHAGDLTSSMRSMDTLQWLAMYRDLVGGLAPGKPQCDGEFHVVNERRTYPANWMRAIYFQAYVHGLSASYLWAWDRSDNIDSAILLDAGVLMGLAETALDLRRLAAQIIAFHRQPAKVAMLYSQSSAMHTSLPDRKVTGPLHLKQLKTTYEGLFFEGTKIGFVSQRRAEAGDFGDAQVLIVPAASHVTDACVEGIRKFAQSGRTVVLVGECFGYDVRNQPRAVTMNEPTIVRMNSLIKPPQVRKAFAPILAKPEIAGTVRVQSSPALAEIEWRHATINDGRTDLVYLVNIGRLPTTATVTRCGMPTAGVDLISGKNVEATIKLMPLDTYLVELAPNP